MPGGAPRRIAAAVPPGGFGGDGRAVSTVPGVGPGAGSPAIGWASAFGAGEAPGIAGPVQGSDPAGSGDAFGSAASAATSPSAAGVSSAAAASCLTRTGPGWPSRARASAKLPSPPAGTADGGAPGGTAGGGVAGISMPGLPFLRGAAVAGLQPTGQPRCASHAAGNAAGPAGSAGAGQPSPPPCADIPGTRIALPSAAQTGEPPCPCSDP